MSAVASDSNYVCASEAITSGDQTKGPGDDRKSAERRGFSVAAGAEAAARAGGDGYAVLRRASGRSPAGSSPTATGRSAWFDHWLHEPG